MRHRAYALWNVKAVEEDRRTIEGIATTPAPDRMNDVIEPEGVEFKLPLPLLYQHNSRQPIGHVLAAKVTKDGIAVKAQVAAAGVADFIDEAWNLIKAGLVRGLSIGFKSLEESYDRETGGFHFLRTEWIELSAVTIPANAEATITAVKSAAASLRAASGQQTQTAVGLASTVNCPGVAGFSGKGTITMKPVAEQIAGFENKRAALDGRMTELMGKAAEEGRTLEAAETEEYDNLTADVKSIDEHLARLRAHEKTIVAKAVAVTPAATAGSENRAATRSGTGVVTVKSVLPKATAFTRYAIALLNSRGNRLEAAEHAKQLWSDSTPEVELVLRAESRPGTTTHPTWAAPLVPTAETLAAEFLELLRPATVVGRIPGLRRVPFNVRIPSQTAGGLYQWVGEGAAKPVGQLAFADVTLRWAKLAGIIVLTKELVRFSNPSAEAIVRDDMVRGVAAFIDLQFVDPAVAEVANVSPASITNGASNIPASGTTADAFRTDMKALFELFLTANTDPSRLVVLMSAKNALGLSLLLNPLGQPEFGNISMAGGSIMGLPAVVSEAVGNRIIVLDAMDILLADDGGVDIDVSEQASLQMNTTPGTPGSPVANTEMVSLWQANLVGLRVDRYITWKRARQTSVAYISNANYG
jgi:HK97 family phage major capsid protein/HK97 family phage prohead protease